MAWHATIRGDLAILADLTRIGNQIAGALQNPDPIQDIVASTILVQMDQECDPEGVPWEKLSPSYSAWKGTVAPGAEMGRLDGFMKDYPNMRGRAQVAGDVMTLSYGVDPLAIEHAVKFTWGGIVTGTNQPARPFWGLNALSERELTQFFFTLVTV